MRHLGQINSLVIEHFSFYLFTRAGAAIIIVLYYYCFVLDLDLYFFMYSDFMINFISIIIIIFINLQIFAKNKVIITIIKKNLIKIAIIIIIYPD